MAQLYNQYADDTQLYTAILSYRGDFTDILSWFLKTVQYLNWRKQSEAEPKIRITVCTRIFC